MSLNLSSYIGKLSEKNKKNNEKKRGKLIEEIKKMVKNMQQKGEEPLSDEEFQELVELAAENINEKRHSLDLRRIWERYKLYKRRKEILAKEILRLKKESRKENMKKVGDLMDKLNDGENNGEKTIQIPPFSNTFKKE